MKAVLKYLIITFGITYACWWGVAVLVAYTDFVYGDMLPTFIYVIGNFGPAIASLFCIEVIEKIFILLQKTRNMVFPFIRRPRYAHRRTFFNGMESANDGAEFFYLVARFHLCLRRRGRTWLARNFTAHLI